MSIFSRVSNHRQQSEVLSICPMTERNRKTEARFRRHFAKDGTGAYYIDGPEWLTMPQICQLLHDHHEGCADAIADFVGEHGYCDRYHRAAVYTFLGY